MLKKDEKIDNLKKKVLMELLLSNNKIQGYYGIVGVRTRDNNFAIDVLLHKEVCARHFIEDNVRKLSLKIVMAKQNPSYKNL